ncbi:MAG: hypothetical protein FJ091_18335 [Deltaproteobacteria bacterium]|nr:hypothetical protein [Deltaproteobacteria bacterium]
MGLRRIAGLVAALACAVASANEAMAQTTMSPAGAAAMRVLDEQLSAYNASDKQAFLITLHFPHVRIAGNNVRVYPNAQSYLPELSMKQIGWDYARWTDRKIVRDSATKVHVAATFTRFLANGRAVDSFEGLYIIALKGGRWGVLARSSYAP